MHLHHLNCGTISVPAGASLIGTGGFFTPARGVTHCIMAETDDGLLLVDTGWGTRACLSPTFPMRLMITMSGTRCSLEETAIRQVERLGYSPQDVKHIALTHFHFDHAGRLPDFPHAKVHVHREEYEAITQPRDMYGRYPYRTEHWAHGPGWVVHDPAGDRWFGFDCTPLVDLGQIAFLPGAAGPHPRAQRRGPAAGRQMDPPLRGRLHPPQGRRPPRSPTPTLPAHPQALPQPKPRHTPHRRPLAPPAHALAPAGRPGTIDLFPRSGGIVQVRDLGGLPSPLDDTTTRPLTGTPTSS